MKRFIIFLFVLPFLTDVIHAQVTEVSGIVVDKSAEPIVGATVLVKGTTIGTITDIDGKFQIANIPDGSTTLVSSFIGMQSKELPISSDPIRFVLESDMEEIDEVIVSGYTTSKKAAYTGAAQVVSGEAIKTKTDANPLKSMEGSVAGFQMNAGSGQPGAYSSTLIRGASSLNSGTEPLYVIDGMPMYNESLTDEDNGRGMSPIANLNANDIESMTVLKDATATSIYGSRAANGVIVITTKRGKKGEAKINFSAQYGSTFLGHMDHNYNMVGLDKYKEIWTEGVQNAYEDGSLSSTTDLSDANNAYQYVRAQGISRYSFDMDSSGDTDWLDLALKESTVQKYDVSIQGGQESLTYFASLGYYSNGGIVVGSGLSRYAGRLNMDGKKGRVGYGVSTSFSSSDVDEIAQNSSYTNPIVLAYDSRPFQNPYNEDGSYSMYNDATNSNYNLVALYDEENGDDYSQKMTIINWNPYFTVDILDGLKWKTSAGLSVNQSTETLYQGIYNPSTYSGGEYVSTSNTKNVYSVKTYTISNTLNYQHTFNKKHDLNILLGQEAHKEKLSSVSAAAEGYPEANVSELVNASTPTTAESTSDESSLASFFSNFEYGYNDKYYLSASFRYDGSSRFGANHRWAPFWSFGGKYRLTQEDFMKQYSGWLYNFMVHASYGCVGNQDIGYYAAKGLYSYGYAYNGDPGAVPTQIENPDLKWETVYKADLGFNMNFWGKLDVDIDLYSEQTKDMIFDVPLTMTTGFSSVTQNIGQMSNKGIELMLSSTLIKTKDFSWNTSVTYTHNKNEIVKMATDDPITSSYNIQQKGSALNTFYLQEWAGVDSETGEGLWYTNGKGSATTTDLNEASYVTLGQPSPKYYGAVKMNFTYKNFDFSFDLSYSGGNKVFNRGFQYDMTVGAYSLGAITNYVYDNRWKEPGDKTNVPRFIWGENDDASAKTSRFLMDASYARVKNVSLGYKISDDVCKKIGINNLRVFASVDNLYTFTAKDFIGFDPQARADGFVQWAYPVATTALFGLNMSF